MSSATLRRAHSETNPRISEERERGFPSNERACALRLFNSDMMFTKSVNIIISSARD